MAITYISSSGNSNWISSGTAAVSVSVPSSISNGDLLIAVITLGLIQGGTLSSVTPPAGWTAVATYAGTYTGVACFYKYASSESGSYSFSATISSSGTATLAGFVAAYRNAASSNPIDTYGWNEITSAAGVYTGNSITTEQSNDLLIAIYQQSFAKSTLPTWTIPGTETKRLSEAFYTDSIYRAPAILCDEILPTSGATGTRTASTTDTTATHGQVLLLAISPGAGPKNYSRTASCGVGASSASGRTLKLQRYAALAIHSPALTTRRHGTYRTAYSWLGTITNANRQARYGRGVIAGVGTATSPPSKVRGVPRLVSAAIGISTNAHRVFRAVRHISTHIGAHINGTRFKVYMYFCHAGVTTTNAISRTIGRVRQAFCAVGTSASANDTYKKFVAGARAIFNRIFGIGMNP